MRQLSPARRGLIALLAIAQMAAPAIVTVADARLAAQSGGAQQVHVEDHTGRGCRPAHPDDCALCQLLSHIVAPRAGAAVLPSAVVLRGGSGQDIAAVVSSAERSLERSRAPPVA
jgi:hypothetical protein